MSNEGAYRTVGPDAADIAGHGVADLRQLGFRHFLVGALPQGQKQRGDAVQLFRLEHVVVRVERVEADRMLFGVGEVNPVPALGLVVYQLAQTLVRIARIHEYDMRSLLVVLAHEVVHKERFARPRRPQYEFVAVGDPAPAHRLVRDVQMQRLAAYAVAHLDPEGAARRAVVRLARKEAQGRLDKGVERLLGGEIPCVARHGRPVERRGVHRVVAGAALHLGELAARVVADAAQLLRVVAPRHDVEVRPDRGQPERVRLVQISVDVE